MDSGLRSAGDDIRILPVDLLDEARPLVEDFRRLSRRLGIHLGWHYLLDLSWVAGQLPVLVPGMRVLDAGAGQGLMQWWLAEQKVDVISVDRASRGSLPRLLRWQYPIRGLRDSDLSPAPRLGLRALWRALSFHDSDVSPGRLPAILRACIGRRNAGGGKGTVILYNQDLSCMPDIADSSVDAIVSVSSLEHNSPEALCACLEELLRVLKPGGKIIATLGAARDADWFHEPSRGWCYTEATLRRIFNLPQSSPSNYESYDRLMEKLRNCAELRNNLADVYFTSGDNGMPWGRWDPHYQPVGIVKFKAGNLALP